jgi:hypothetical protein
MSNFFSEYIAWGAKRSSRLTSSEKLEFMADFAEPLDVAFGRLQEMAETVPKGKGFLVAYKYIAWISNYADPLKPAREAVKRIKTKWGSG